MTNIPVRVSDDDARALYASAVSFLTMMEQVRWARLNTFLVANSIPFLAWITLFAGKSNAIPFVSAVGYGVLSDTLYAARDEITVRSPNTWTNQISSRRTVGSNWPARSIGVKMDEKLLVPLLGVAFGALAAFFGQWLAGRLTYRKEMRRIAYEAAVEEFKAHRETIAKRPSGGVTNLAPLIHYVAFHMDVIDTKMSAEDFERALTKSERRLETLMKRRPNASNHQS